LHGIVTSKRKTGFWSKSYGTPFVRQGNRQYARGRIDRPCEWFIIAWSVNSALQSVALGLLDEHLGHCVSHAVAEGGDEADKKLAEASAAIARLVRS